MNRPTQDPWWMNLIMMVVFVLLGFFWMSAMETTIDANTAMHADTEDFPR